jgi:hypothetical protein
MLYGDAALEVKAKYITKGNDFVVIAGKFIFILKVFELTHHIFLSLYRSLFFFFSLMPYHIRSLNKVY